MSASAIEAVKIEVGDGAQVSGVLRIPSGEPRFAIALAHGAGSDMNARSLVEVADGLAELGHLTLRFNFLYKEAKRNAPDRGPVLERTWRAVADFMRPRAPRLILGGRSMGGRYASMIAAKGAPCDGLVFLSYPLHPAGKPEKLRDAHLPEVVAPMLFVQGTRDPLCRMDLLTPVLARLGPRARLHVVEGGDHSLDVLKSTGRTHSEVLADVLAAIDGFLRAAPGA